MPYALCLRGSFPLSAFAVRAGSSYFALDRIVGEHVQARLHGSLLPGPKAAFGQ